MDVDYEKKTQTSVPISMLMSTELSMNCIDITVINDTIISKSHIMMF